MLLYQHENRIPPSLWDGWMDNVIQRPFQWNDCAQWNPVYHRKYPGPKRCSNPGPLDQQASAYTTELPGLLSLGDGSILTEYCLKEPLNPETTYQPNEPLNPKTTYQPNVPMINIESPAVNPQTNLKSKWNYWKCDFFSFQALFEYTTKVTIQ